MIDALPVARVWAVDFEYTAPPGGLPVPVCCVARDLKSDAPAVECWFEGGRPPPCPYGTGPGDLVVAYTASAEMNCHLVLGWPIPANILDPYAEFRWLRSGLGRPPAGWGLLGALAHFGLDSMAAGEKEEMRQLVLRGGPYTADDRRAILDYCRRDVDALGLLLPAMLPHVDLPRALLRGRYMAAVARMERTGVPIDTPTLSRLVANWDGIRGRLVGRVDAGYGVYDGTTFKRDRFRDWLAARGVPWPRLPSGELDLKDDTFRQMARACPAVAPLHELRATLSGLKLHELAVGPDGRNRTMLGVFRSKTGRNQPGNSEFVFGLARWIRGLIKPGPGGAVAYVDWSQQEFGIAAALSGDPAMLAAYRSGDPYLAFAVLAGAAPPGATKETHRAVRDRYKQCVLAVQYGQGADGLAARLGVGPAEARVLMDHHRRVFARYWAWSDAAQDEAMLRGELRAAFGWRTLVGPDPNPRSLRNFVMQANGSEMMRLAAIRATEEGVRVCAPVHDAFLVEGPADGIGEMVERMQAAMAWASRQVLGGFELASDAKVVCYPERYMDPAGEAMWDTVTGLLPSE